MAKKKSSNKEISLNFISFESFNKNNSDESIKKILKMAKKGNIVVIEGRLSPVHETNLIEATMETIDKKFKGIEIASINKNGSIKEQNLMSKFGDFIFDKLYGRKRGLTIVGPATLVKKIKRDPDNITLQMS